MASLVQNMIGYPVPRNARQTTGPAGPEQFGRKIPVETLLGRPRHLLVRDLVAIQDARYHEFYQKLTEMRPPGRRVAYDCE